MVSVDKIQRGAARYVDTEILPKVEGKDKWIITSALTLYLAKLPALIQTLKDKDAVKILGIISEDGQSVDIDTLINSVKPAAQQTPAAFKIPFGGTLNLTASDLDSLRNYIMQA